MPAEIARTLKDIKKAVEALQQERPKYSDIIALYGELFTAQEKSVPRVSLSSNRKQLEHHDVEDEKKFPCVSPSQFDVDIKASDALLQEICHIIVTRGKENAPSSAQLLLDAVNRGSVDTRSLYRRFLEDDDEYSKKYSAEFGIDPHFLDFVIYHSIRPSLYVFAQQLGDAFSKEYRWEKGSCPVCGSRPAIGLLEKDGTRSLFCSFCWYGWNTQRVYCPFCNNNDSNKLKYYEIESEREYRIDVCEDCRNYIKTVDLRNTDRLVYPPLENLSTLHLDVKAQELGYENEAMPLFEI